MNKPHPLIFRITPHNGFRENFLIFQKAFSGILLIIFLHLFACENNGVSPNDTPLPPPSVIIINSSVPDILYSGYTEDILITATAVETFEASFIRFRIKNSSGSVQYSDTLFDNAEKGDLVPGDLVFSRSLNTGGIFSSPGQYTVEYSSIDVDFIRSDTVIVLDGEKNLPPVVSNLVFPETVSIDTNRKFFYVFVDVQDPQGENDIAAVIGKLYFPGSITPALTIKFRQEGIDPKLLPGENSYIFIFQPRDLAVRGQGEYTLLVYAEDNSGLVSNELVHYIHFISGEPNEPPILSDLVAPDTLYAAGQTDTIRIKVTDPDGQNDIRLVYFESFLPNGNPSKQNPFYMFDDGGLDRLSGDKVPFDGEYSIVISVPASSTPGEYLFMFYATDYMGNTSQPVSHTITMLPGESQKYL